MKPVTAEEALRVVKSSDHIFIHSVAGAPQQLIRALVNRADELRNVQIYHLHTEGNADYTKLEYEKSFFLNALFVGKNAREAVNNGRGSYIPVFLSEVPSLFRKHIIPLDIALISVSPPDKHGYCSLGTSVDATLAAVQMSTIVIAQVNKHMPRVNGDGQIHMNDINIMVPFDEPIMEVPIKEPSDKEMTIGRYVAGLIEDGSTIQTGIGAIPNAVLASLHSHKNLGIHTEMFSDGVIPLVERGVINGKFKKIMPGKVLSSFVMGSKKLYDFIDDNPEVVLMDCSYVNDTHIIRQNPKMISINSAIEIDLTGQVCADSIGESIFSGVGGQMDFIRGASLSEGGKPIIALPSVTNGGLSRIVPTLKAGAGVVTTRAHVHYVITEFGIANLYGKNMEQRAKALINIAHPDHRDALEESLRKSELR